jgi:hypothetical protein
MQGREFLDLARQLLTFGNSPLHWRAVIIHAYYALLLECRDAMIRWALPPLPRQQVHAQVRLRLIYATNRDLKKLGDALEVLNKHRNAASYDLQSLPLFASAKVAQADLQLASDSLSLLDSLDADPLRRAAAITSIQP